MPRDVTPKVRGITPRWALPADDYVTSLAWSPGGDVLVVGDASGALRAVEGARGTVRWKVDAHAGGVLCAEVSSQGMLATAGQDGRATLRGLATGRELAVLPSGGGAWVEHLAWRPDGAMLATAAGRSVRFWSAIGEPRVETPAQASTVAGLAWRRDGAELASICYGGVHFWVPDDASCARVFAWKGSLISVAWSPDGKVIACGSQDNSVHFWRLSTGNDSEMSGYPSKPRALSWDAKSSLLATSGGEEVCVWDFAGKGPEGSRPRLLKGHGATVQELSFSPRRGMLASAAEDGGLLLWEPRSSAAPSLAAMLDSPASVLAWHPTEHRLAVACADGAVALFSLT